MSLQQVPPEILSEILQNLGSAFFRHDTRRLLVSRKWYHFALPVFLRDLCLSAESLKPFTDVCESQRMRTLVRRYSTTVSIKLDRRDNSKENSALPSRTGGRAIDHSDVDDDWLGKMNDWLLRLVDTLNGCTRVKCLRFEMRSGRRPPGVDPEMASCLNTMLVGSLLTVCNLTCIELDVPEMDIWGPGDDLKWHICEHINKVLPGLRRLRCRMTCICPRVLQAPGDDPLPLLEEVIINLSLSELSASDTSYRWTRRCRSGPGEVTYAELKAALESSARELARRMRNPRVVRIRSHTFPGLEMQALDVLTGRVMLIEPEGVWDVEGEEVEDSAAEEEEDDIFDSDSSLEGEPFV